MNPEPKIVSSLLNWPAPFMRLAGLTELMAGGGLLIMKGREFAAWSSGLVMLTYHVPFEAPERLKVPGNCCFSIGANRSGNVCETGSGKVYSCTWDELHTVYCKWQSSIVIVTGIWGDIRKNRRGVIYRKIVDSDSCFHSKDFLQQHSIFRNVVSVSDRGYTGFDYLNPQ